MTTNSTLPVAPLTQMVPTNPAPGQAVDIWVKVGYKFQIDTCYIYYTTDQSNPEGAFGVGKGTTQVVQAHWVNGDSQDSTIDWWKGTIPGVSANTQVRYKVALFNGGYGPIGTISDADQSKLYGLTQFGITNFNPTTATLWLHNDLNTNNTAVGLSSGFHIVRSRCFLPRSGKSGVYNTFLQTFYYAGQLPTGVIAYPATDGSTITNTSYTVVVRADSSVTEVDYCVTDNNGQTCGVAPPVSPDATLSQQYTNYPQEYRFTYSPVASSGTATISVHLKDVASTCLYQPFRHADPHGQTHAPLTVLEYCQPGLRWPGPGFGLQQYLHHLILLHRHADHHQLQPVQHLHQWRVPAAAGHPRQCALQHSAIRVCGWAAADLSTTGRAFPRAPISSRSTTPTGFP